MTIESQGSALVSTLSDAVTGPVLLPGDDEFAEEAAGFQLGLEHRPDVIAGARTAGDVAAVMRAASASGAAVTVHATGHGMSHAASGGVLLTLHRMNGVRVDPETRTARVAGGATWADVLDAAAPYGLVPPSGSLGSVGAVGYTFGGGLSLLARSDGWASDRVRSFAVVTADGEEREVGPEDAEWFAHLRGSGPRAGEVVTAMTIGLLQEGPLQGGGLTFDIGATGSEGDPTIPLLFREWTAGLPDTLTSTLRVMAFPDLDYLPARLRGRRIARVAVAFRGTPEEAGQLVAPLRRAAPAMEDTLAPMLFAEYPRVHAEPEAPGAFIGENVLLSRIDQMALVALASSDGPEMTIINIRHLGGALARPAPLPDTVQGRSAAYLVSALSSVDPAVSVPDPAAAHRASGPSWALEPFNDAAVGASPAFSVGPRGQG